MSKVRFGRIHKRPFVVGVIVFLIFILVGGFLVGYLGFFARGAELDRVRFGDEEVGAPVLGFGLSLDYMPTANYVVNPSFENIQMDYMFTLQEGTDNYAFLMMEPDQNIYFEDGAFEGGNIRVMALDEEGRLYQKLNSVIDEFNVNQLGLWREFDNIPDNLNATFRFITASDTQIVAFADDGYIVSGIGTADVSVMQMSAEGKCVASDYSGGRFSVLYSDGTILTSTDGRNFSAFSVAFDEAEDTSPFNTIASVNRALVVAGEDGCINVIYDGKIMAVDLISDFTLNTASGDGDVLMLFGDNQEMIVTANGTVFRQLSIDEKPVSTSVFNWVSSAFYDGNFVVAGEEGQLAKGYYDSAKGSFSFQMLIDTNTLLDPIFVRDIMIDASGEIIMLDHSGLVYIYERHTQQWALLSMDSSGDVVSLHSAPNRKIVLLTSDSIYTTSLVIRVAFEDHLAHVDLSAGDMCFVTHQRPTFDVSQTVSTGENWDVFGEDTVAMSVFDSPVSGAHMSLKISGYTGSDQSAHFVSQQLAVENEILFSENIFYRIDLYLKQSGLDSGEVMVWLSGDFDPVGTTFSDVGTGWRRYSFRMVMPREACGVLSDEVRLNIGFYGDGEVFIDNVFLGRDVHSADEMAQQFSNVIVDSSPQFLRFPSLAIGQQGLSIEALFSLPGNDRLLFGNSGYAEPTGLISIESALRLARSSGAYPWFVVDSSAEQEQVNMLMSYLCGSISDPIGKLRIDNGTAVPWNRQFDRLVLEIGDSDSIFISDIQRGAYVNYVIELLESSPYYLDIKDKIILVDAMHYDGGVMLSEADYHASSLHVNQTLRPSLDPHHDQIQRVVSNAYLDYYDVIPRVTGRPFDIGGQWIHSSSIFLSHTNEEDMQNNILPYQIDAATYLFFVLNDFGRHTSLFCADVQVSHNPYDLFTDNLFSNDHLPDTASRQIQSLNNGVMFRVLNLLGEYISGAPTHAFITPSLSDISERVRAGDESIDTHDYEGLMVYAFRDEDTINAFIINISDEPRSFMIETVFFSRDIAISKYSEQAHLINSSSVRRPNVRHVLLPGHFLIVSGSADDTIFSD